jgi:hypothetical protein
MSKMKVAGTHSHTKQVLVSILKRFIVLLPDLMPYNPYPWLPHSFIYPYSDFSQQSKDWYQKPLNEPRDNTSMK